MAVSDVLKNFRKGGYSEKPAQDEKESSGGNRTFKLMDEEVKELQGYSEGPGKEQQCLVTGRLGEDGEFTVISVHSPNGESTMPDQEDMAAQVMGKPSMMQAQTIPSPS